MFKKFGIIQTILCSSLHQIEPCLFYEIAKIQILKKFFTPNVFVQNKD